MKFPERIAWIVVVIVVTAWSMTKSDSDDRQPDDVTETSQPGRSRDQSLPEKQDSSARISGGRGLTNRSSLETQSLRALRSNDPLSRLSEFLKVLSSADAANFHQVEETLNELKASGMTLPIEEDMMHFRAGQLRGADLMADHMGSPEDFARMGILKKQYEGWIQSDPRSAGRWLDGLPAGKYRDQMAVSYIAACTKDDPVGSFGLVSSLHPSQQAAAGRAVAEQLAETASLDEASAVFQTIEANAGGSNNHYLSTMFDSLLSNIERGDDSLAVSLVESHLDQPYVTGLTLARVSAERAKSDPQAALEWAVSMEGRKNDLPEGEVVASAIRGMTLEGLSRAENWATTQEDGASYWLNLIEKRRELLEDRQGDENKYDRDD